MEFQIRRMNRISIYWSQLGGYFCIILERWIMCVTCKHSLLMNNLELQGQIISLQMLDREIRYFFNGYLFERGLGQVCGIFEQEKKQFTKLKLVNIVHILDSKVIQLLVSFKTRLRYGLGLAETRTLVHSFNGISGIHNIDYFPNKFLVSAHENFSICLWNIENRMLATKKINCHQATVFCVKFSIISKLIGSGSFDNSIKIWNTVTKKLVNRFNGHVSGVTAISFSSDGWFLASGSQDESIALWNISNRKYISFYGHTNYHVSALQFSWDGKYLVSGSFDQTLKVQIIGNMTK